MRFSTSKGTPLLFHVRLPCQRNRTKRADAWGPSLPACVPMSRVKQHDADATHNTHTHTRGDKIDAHMMTVWVRAAGSTGGGGHEHGDGDGDDAGTVAGGLGLDRKP